MWGALPSSVLHTQLVAGATTVKPGQGEVSMRVWGVSMRAELGFQQEPAAGP